MKFRDPLYLYLAKILFPFSFLSVNRIDSVKQLRAIPQNFWIKLANRNDVHLKYTTEFIAWRFLDAPHKKYVVSAVYKHGELIGLHVTRRFKGHVDLMVDFISPIEMLGDLLSSVRRPTLVMYSDLGAPGNAINKGCWRLPLKRQFPFFVTTWDQDDIFDMSGITLAASDF